MAGRPGGQGGRPGTLFQPRVPDTQGHGWETWRGKGEARAVATSKPPFQCPDLSSGSSFTRVPWASGLCLLEAKWPEAKGSQWPWEKKGRRIINPGTKVSRGRAGLKPYPSSIPLQGQHRLGLPAPPLGSRRMLRAPPPLWSLDTAGRVTASSRSVSTWGPLPWSLEVPELWDRAPGRGGPACLPAAVSPPRPLGQAQADGPRLVCWRWGGPP